ncbi:MAG TPA: hypothetical protein VMW24_02410 [Sedimentisphaerales bacterium]|nr:hypothetical protein [Sedimentisphaerales bacterium]
MSGRFPLGRIIATCVAVFFLGVAGVSFLLFYANRAYFWHPARFKCLAALSVDFSTPGTYSASFNYYPPIISDGLVGLDIPKRTLSQTPPEVLLSGLQGTYSILDAEGRRIFNRPLVEESNKTKMLWRRNIIVLGNLGSWYDNKVAWQMNVTVTQGAAHLERIPHRFVLMDRAEASVAIDRISIPCALLTCAALPAGAIILAVVVRKSLRKRKQPMHSH